MVASNRPSHWAFRLTIIVLIAMFLAIVWQRDRIRAHWCVHRIVASTDLQERGLFLAQLTAIGPDAIGAIRRLARSDDPDLRNLAAFALGSIKGDGGIPDLTELAADRDRSVRDAAVTALALMQRKEATSALCSLAESPDESTACAAASVLNRVDDALSRDSLCRLSKKHPSPLVRAQAIESLMDLESPAHGDCSTCAILAGALTDSATFTGPLALERERLAAEEFASKIVRSAHPPTSQIIDLPGPKSPARSMPAPRFGPRTISQLAADYLTARTGQSLDWARLPLDAIIAKCSQAATSRPASD